MKTLKLLMVFIAVIVFSTILFADNPTTETADDISNSMVENLNSQVSLTPDQKVILKKKANEYSVSLLQARTMSNKDSSYIFMRVVTNNYEAAIDSVLTTDQKALKEKIKKERIDALAAKITKLNSNK
jgi:ABC-type transporter MlaC component